MGAPVPSRVTAADVAALAGVSQSAVSRVFTPGASASSETARKVREAAQELGYRPNVLARSLITGRSRIIGLVVAYLDNYFYPQALEQLSRGLQARGYHVLVFMASQTAGNVDNVVEEILDYQVDGIVAASVALSSDLTARCRSAGVPVVLFNRASDDDTLAITSDNVRGGRLVARFLADGGHRRIAYLAGWEGASTQRDREAGFRAGLAEAGLTLHGRARGAYEIETARAATRALMAQSTPPDAIFAANDHMAIAAMDVLRFELGLNVPQDVSVVGFDDVPPAAWPAYDLTTVRQDATAMIAATIDTLIDRIDGAGPETGRIMIAAPLVIRSSARKPEGMIT